MTTLQTLTPCRQATQKDMIALPCIVDGSCLSTFPYMSCTCLSAGLAHFSLQGYRQLDAVHLGLKVQTNRPFMTPYFQNRKTATKGPLTQILSLVSFSCNHGFAWNVLQEDDILCELNADTRSDVSDYSDNEIMDSDSDVPTTTVYSRI